MMNIKQYAILGALFISTLVWSTTSSASSILGIYAGVSAGQAEIENTSPTQDSTASKVYAGYRILGPIAIEVARVDLGEFGVLPTSIDGIAVDAVLYLPAGLINVFAKAGVFNWNVDYNGALPADSGTNTKFGFGVEYNLLLNVDLRLEWETYTGVGGSTINEDISVISIGANIAF